MPESTSPTEARANRTAAPNHESLEYSELTVSTLNYLKLILSSKDITTLGEALQKSASPPPSRL